MNKEKILSHIRAAKFWLDKAEEFVKNNQLTKGLLNLLLANAEIRIPLKESFRKEEKIEKKSLFIKRLPAFTIAASIVILIFISTYVITTQYQSAKREVTKKAKKEVIIKEVVKKEPIIIKEVKKEEPLKEVKVTPAPKVEAKAEVKKVVIKKAKRISKRPMFAKKEIIKEEKPYEREIVEISPPPPLPSAEVTKKKEKEKEKIIIEEKIYDLMKYAEDILKSKDK